MDVRGPGRRRLALTTVGVGALAVGGAVAVGATRPAPAHASTRRPSTRGVVGLTTVQPTVAAPQPASGAADAGSSGS